MAQTIEKNLGIVKKEVNNHYETKVKQLYDTLALAQADTDTSDISVYDLIAVTKDTTASKNGVYSVTAIDGTMTLEYVGKVGEVNIDTDDFVEKSNHTNLGFIDDGVTGVININNTTKEIEVLNESIVIKMGDRVATLAKGYTTSFLSSTSTISKYGVILFNFISKNIVTKARQDIITEDECILGLYDSRVNINLPTATVYKVKMDCRWTLDGDNKNLDFYNPSRTCSLIQSGGFLNFNNTTKVLRNEVAFRIALGNKIVIVPIRTEIPFIIPSAVSTSDGQIIFNFKTKSLIAVTSNHVMNIDEGHVAFYTTDKRLSELDTKVISVDSNANFSIDGSDVSPYLDKGKVEKVGTILQPPSAEISINNTTKEIEFFQPHFIYSGNNATTLLRNKFSFISNSVVSSREGAFILNFTDSTVRSGSSVYIPKKNECIIGYFHIVDPGLHLPTATIDYVSIDANWTLDGNNLDRDSYGLSKNCLIIQNGGYFDFDNATKEIVMFNDTDNQDAREKQPRIAMGNRRGHLEWKRGYSFISDSSLDTNMGLLVFNFLTKLIYTKDVEYILGINEGHIGTFWTDKNIGDATTNVLRVELVSGNYLIDGFNDSDPTGIIFNNRDAESKLVAVSARNTFSPTYTEALGKPILTLLHCSDIHSSMGNLRRLVHFASRYERYIDNIMFTGDMRMSYDAGSIPFYDHIHTSKVVALTALGNHEASSAPSPERDAILYNGTIKPYVDRMDVVQPPNAEANKYSYFYKDYPDSEIRLIVYDSNNEVEHQLTWLSTTLDGAKAKDYSVVIACHHPLPDLVTDADNNTFTTVNNVTHTSLSASTALVVQDFITSGGMFICYLAGHMHRDLFGYNADYPEQLCIAIECAGFPTRESAREEGTKSQDCFNVVGFDTTAKIIKIARIGSNYDRNMRRKNTLCYHYVDKKVIAND